MARILVVDDDALVAESILNVARGLGHNALGRSTCGECLDLLRRETFDVLFLDVHLPDGSGLEILPLIQTNETAPEVIIITGFGDSVGAETAIKNGAWDYLQKPLDVQDIRLPLERALQYREKKAAATPLRAVRREGIIGDSARLRLCFDGLAQAASSEANVLITGETGTGKELFAWAIHQNSPRHLRRFVVVDCAALPETLVESTLFGHLKGAFTGADQSRDGLIKQADGGTLFLDEIGEMPLSIQKAFLRVLQERRYRPVGGGREIESDFRLIAATNRDLNAMVREGRFREELLYRLRTLTIDIPPLREHLDDLKDLALATTSKLCDHYKISMKGFSSGFWNILRRYAWPGNVRELIQALERAILAAKNEPVLFSKHLPPHIRIHVARTAIGEKRDLSKADRPADESPPTLGRWEDVRGEAVEKAEREYLGQLIKASAGHVSKACQISGLSRARLYALLKKHRLQPRDERG